MIQNGDSEWPWYQLVEHFSDFLKCIPSFSDLMNQARLVCHTDPVSPLSSCTEMGCSRHNSLCVCFSSCESPGAHSCPIPSPPLRTGSYRGPHEPSAGCGGAITSTLSTAPFLLLVGATTDGPLYIGPLSEQFTHSVLFKPYRPPMRP